MREKIREALRFLNRADGSLKSKTIRSSFWVGVSNAGTNSLSFVRTIILARLLTPEVFGLMSICMIVKRGIDIFTETGFAAALIQRKERFEDAKDTAFTLMVARGFVLAGGVFLAAPFVADYYERDVLDAGIKVMGLMFIFSGFMNINAIGLQKELDFKQLTYHAQLTAVVSLVVVVALAYVLGTVWSLIIGQVVTALVAAVLSYAMIPGRMQFKFEPRMARELFGYGKFITGVAIFGFIASEIDNAVVGKILGMEALGLYVIAYKLATFPASHFSKIMARMMLPVCSKLQDDLAKMRSVYLKVLRIVSGLAVPVAVGMAILAEEMLYALYGARWVPAADVLRVLCVCGAVLAIGSWGYIFNGLGKPHISFYLSLGRALGIAVLVYPMTQRFGLVGAAVAATVPIVIQLPIQMIVVARLLDMKVFDSVKSLAPAVLSSAAMAVVVWTLKGMMEPTSLPSLMVLVGAGIATYAILNQRDIKALVKNGLDLRGQPIKGEPL